MCEVSCFLAHLWKHDEVTGKLQNKAYNWMYGDVSWNIPNEGEEGYIEDRADPLRVMTVMPIIKVKSPAPSIEPQRDEELCILCDNKVNNTGDTITDSTDTTDNTADNTTNDITNDTTNDTDIPIIELKAKEDSLLNEQLWLRTFIRDDGFFTLENETTGAQLTACRLDVPEYKPSELEGLHWVSTFLLAY